MGSGNDNGNGNNQPAYGGHNTKGTKIMGESKWDKFKRQRKTFAYTMNLLFKDLRRLLKRPGLETQAEYTHGQITGSLSTAEQLELISNDERDRVFRLSQKVFYGGKAETI